MIRRHLTPALFAFLALLAGCLAAPGGAVTWWAASGAAVAAAASAVTLLAGGSSDGIRRRAGLLLLGAAAGFALGAASQSRMGTSFQASFLPMPESEVTEVSGVVVRDSLLTRQDETVVPIELTDAFSSRRGLAARAHGGMLLLIPGDWRFSIGEKVTVRAAPVRLEALGPQRWIARARPRDVRSRGFSCPVWSARAQAREWLHRSISAIGYPASALLEALLVGVRQDVPPDLYQGFARTGSLHVLALSGLHVAVIYGVASALLGRLLRGRGTRFLAATLVLLFYQGLAGFMPSLLRATVMIVIAGTAALRDRDREPLNVLALSGTALLLIDPFQAFTVSFQLSFLALAGIIVLGALLQRPLASSIPRFLLAAFAMSAGAQAATLPLVIGTFGAWYPSGLIANLVLVPLITGYLWAGLAWIPLSVLPWPGLHAACSAAFGAFYHVIHASADLFALVPGFEFSPASLPWLAAGIGLAVTLAATLLPWKVTRARAPVTAHLAP
jgi:ComEC/Rec2-related protein